MLSLGLAACTLPASYGGKGSSVAEDSGSDCGTIAMLRPAEVREGFSRNLDCSRGNAGKTPSGQECIQYTVMLDHGGSFIIAQHAVPSMAVGQRVCLQPDEAGSTAMRAE